MTDPSDWMLSEALSALARAERIHGQFFRIRAASGGVREPRWEPPMDVLETEGEILVFVALPGVDPERVEAVIEDGALIVSGRRTLPPELRNAVIHRLELPQGQFQRRVLLPAGRYSVSRYALNGCIVISLGKLG
ncbi:MAG TPA: Hsp20/alpha crystallin family protein [Devosiaceae bacterium]|nr:Hsp20/alpha crystallin family protein [Devosiaceae bacterium]